MRLSAFPDKAFGLRCFWSSAHTIKCKWHQWRHTYLKSSRKILTELICLFLLFEWGESQCNAMELNKIDFKFQIFLNKQTVKESFNFSKSKNLTIPMKIFCNLHILHSDEKREFK